MDKSSYSPKNNHLFGFNMLQHQLPRWNNNINVNYYCLSHCWWWIPMIQIIFTTIIKMMTPSKQKSLSSNPWTSNWNPMFEGKHNHIMWMYTHDDLIMIPWNKIELEPHYILSYGYFPKWWYPSIIHFSRISHSTPSTLGTIPFIETIHTYIYINMILLHIWRFPELGAPLNHPF